MNMEVISSILSILLIILIGGLIAYLTSVINIDLPSYIFITLILLFLLL